jgi:hypothetical protein
MLARTGGPRCCAAASPTFTRTNATCRITNGPLVAETQIGGKTLLTHVALEGREMGSWNFILNHSDRLWTTVSRVTAADWEPGADGGGRLVVTGEARGSGIAYRVKEAFVFTPGHPAFRVDLVELANTGAKPIYMKRIYFSPIATFAGEVAAKEAQPVPNLWRAPKQSAWFAKDGRFWGVVTDAERIGAMNFHVEPNGSVHPDFAVVPLLRRERREETLAPGEFYVPDPEERMRAWAIPGFGGASEWRRITGQVGPR